MGHKLINKGIPTWNQISRGILPHVKHEVILQCAKEWGMRTFVETGGCRGGTVKAVLKEFDRIITIEMDPTWFRFLRTRFRMFPHVTCLYGDSTVLLPDVLAKIDEPILFWLDAHSIRQGHGCYIATAPIREELAVVMSHPKAKQHMILIDDAWMFRPEIFGSGVPSLLELEQIIKEKWPTAEIEIESQIIKVRPCSR